ncbi:peptidase M28 [Halalkalicoccus jeotgali B3]|uniref:Carboxypeptidase Q n=1 Tax=Halalkalicoccus jeotgali (strain DSM 18796 / CECT 7217 / JCM 14584 / KCTC 4019 / B3) TaxID=795797 RepID=D8J8W6_HALJB|nr:peptidase M28 [Halalkalicoccus jeotgali B3]
MGSAWHDDDAWELLTRLTELDERMGGHPGERRAARFVAESFEDGGVSGIEVEEFEMNRWDRGRAEFAITDPVERSFGTLALPYSAAGEVAGELVDVGYGTPEEIEERDVAGKIAVASTTTPPEKGRFVHRMEKFGHAIAAGAEAFVFANHVPGQLPPTGALRFDAEAAAPGVGVSKETGAWLSDYASQGARAKLSVEASTERGTSQNVHGTLGEGSEEIVLLGHYDAHDIAEGALDNGCGIAVVAGAARILSEMELDCRVRVAGVGCEEVGLIGAAALADSLNPDSVRAVVNVDGAGRFRNLQAYTHGSQRIEELTRETCSEWGQPVSFSRDPHPYSDHWPFLQRGVPALQLHSQAPSGAERGRGWGHTHADTRDKVDPRNLREHAILTALLVRELTRSEIPRIDESELREQLRESDAEIGMRAAEVWPDHWE